MKTKTVSKTKGDVERRPGKVIVIPDPEIEDLIPGYLDHRLGDLRTLRDALEKADYDAIRILGHSMKGSGGGYGFDTISEIGLVLENAASVKDPLAVSEGIFNLDRYLKNVEVAYGQGKEASHPERGRRPGHSRNDGEHSRRRRVRRQDGPKRGASN
jgi:HPt (histidine-containing phosphotransfer) domain-containing protein